ncbi:hypothetical protein KOR42_32180 [Thalassoglobus neptunius]|uniref:DUF2513 domain-containing protein n=1 Tax=Thalassoglobus neptunius TaxID=1938619 RepID=A0A5C5WM87_9PLAN|nr:hypothetical protein KOR42_32180 [Thalassoglobus neptunius]
MLLLVELQPACEFLTVCRDTFPDYDVATLKGHARLLEQSGFVQVVLIVEEGASFRELTWEGHEFVSLCRDPNCWKEAKDKIASIGGSASVEVLRQLLKQIVTSKISGG